MSRRCARLCHAGGTKNRSPACQPCVNPYAPMFCPTLLPGVHRVIQPTVTPIASHTPPSRLCHDPCPRPCRSPAWRAGRRHLFHIRQISPVFGFASAAGLPRASAALAKTGLFHHTRCFTIHRQHTLERGRHRVGKTMAASACHVTACRNRSTRRDIGAAAMAMFLRARCHSSMTRCHLPSAIFAYTPLRQPRQLR